MFDIFRRKREEKEAKARAFEVQKVLREKEIKAEAMRIFMDRQQKEKKRALDDKISSQIINAYATAGLTTDSCGFKSPDSYYGTGLSIPDSIYDWYASQGFIGYQACSILAQHWLVDKACRMPADDAVRGGFDIVAEDQKIIDLLKEFDKKININRAMSEYINFGRVFGKRIAIFVIDTTDPEFYEKPFNIDAVTAGSFKGISQVDQKWIIPELTAENLSNPSSLNFYNPTFYTINGQKYHKSHLCIYTPYPVTDDLKPFYRYGGKPIPQMIYNRVYAAERTADEAPQLALAKRLITLAVDQSGEANNDELEEKINFASTFMNNYGILITGQSETVSQFDTSLADFDNLTMTEYQLVAAVSEVPATKLLGTQPKGFNSTGDYELQNYWQLLNGIRDNELTNLVDRVHEIAIRSYVAPKLGTKDYESIQTEIKWSALDSPTEEKRALINKTKAETAAIYSQAGAIDGEDIRVALNEDKDSDFYGLAEREPEDYEEADINQEADEMGGTEERSADIQGA